MRAGSDSQSGERRIVPLASGTGLSELSSLPVQLRGEVVKAHRFRPAARPLPRNDLAELQGRR